MLLPNPTGTDLCHWVAFAHNEFPSQRVTFPTAALFQMQFTSTFQALHLTGMRTVKLTEKLKKHMAVLCIWKGEV